MHHEGTKDTKIVRFVFFVIIVSSWWKSEKEI